MKRSIARSIVALAAAGSFLAVAPSCTETSTDTHRVEASAVTTEAAPKVDNIQTLDPRPATSPSPAPAFLDGAGLVNELGKFLPADTAGVVTVDIGPNGLGGIPDQFLTGIMNASEIAALKKDVGDLLAERVGFDPLQGQAAVLAAGQPYFTIYLRGDFGDMAHLESETVEGLEAKRSKTGDFYLVPVAAPKGIAIFPQRFLLEGYAKSIATATYAGSPAEGRLKPLMNSTGAALIAGAIDLQSPPVAVTLARPLAEATGSPIPDDYYDPKVAMGMMAGYEGAAFSIGTKVRVELKAQKAKLETLQAQLAVLEAGARAELAKALAGIDKADFGEAVALTVAKHMIDPAVKTLTPKLTDTSLVIELDMSMGDAGTTAMLTGIAVASMGAGMASYLLIASGDMMMDEKKAETIAMPAPVMAEPKKEEKRRPVLPTPKSAP